MATPITAQTVIRIAYTVASFQHRFDAFARAVIVGSDPTTSTLSTGDGQGSGVTLTTVYQDVSDILGVVLPNGSTIDGMTVLNYSSTAPHYYPLAQYTTANKVVVAGGDKGNYAGVLSFSMRNGLTKGRAMIMETAAYGPYPSRGVAPSATGTAPIDKLYQLWVTKHYFVLRDNSTPSVAYRVSANYNRKLEKRRGLR